MGANAIKSRVWADNLVTAILADPANSMDAKHLCSFPQSAIIIDSREFRTSPLPRHGLRHIEITASCLAGEGFFVYVRLYAPTEPYFERSWKLPDLERVR